MANDLDSAAKITLIREVSLFTGWGPNICRRALIACNWDANITCAWLKDHGTALFDWNRPPIQTTVTASLDLLAELSFGDYQVQARKTALYPRDTRREAMAYVVIGLAGEAGEVANKFKKYMRGDKVLTAIKDEIADEMGDILWYLAALANELDLSLDDIARRNLEKLDDRANRNIIKGDGDNR